MSTNNSIRGLNVAHIGGHSYLNPQGGIDFVIGELSKRLVPYKVQTTFYTRNYLHSKGKCPTGIEEKPAFSLRVKFLEMLSYSLVASLKASRTNVDIIHYHTLWSALFSFIPLLSGKRVVVSCHAIEWDRGWNFVVRNIMKLMDQVTLLYDNQLITISRPLFNYYKKKSQKVVYIPNGITIPQLQENKNRREKYILFCSRLVPEKGVHYLIDAFKDLENEFKDYKLYICGRSMHSDAYVDELKKSASDGRKILFLGHVSGKKKHNLFNNASIYVLPSEIEGMSISLLEAMSYGVPALVSNIPENKLVAKKYGFYFKSGDVDSLKSNLRYMLKNISEVTEKANNARSFVSKYYDWNIIAKQYYELYTALVKN